MAAPNPNSIPTYILPAIFTPFDFKFSPPSDDVVPPPRPSGAEKLRIILAKLDAYHDAVRRNMMFLVGVEKERIVKDAISKLKLQEERGELEPQDGASEGGIEEKELNDLLQRLRTPPKEGSDGKDYEVQPRAFPLHPSSLAPDAPDGDVAMGGTSSAAAANRGDERTEMSHEIQALLLRAADEMRLYDIHAATSRKKYEDALQRQLRRDNGDVPMAGSTISATASAGGSAVGSRRGSGILINRNEQVAVDMEALAMMDLDTLEEEVRSEQPRLGRSVAEVARDSRRR